MMNIKTTLLHIFDALLRHFGPRNWWPGETPLEIAIGAILTQNTSWRNVEKAISNLKHSQAIDLKCLNAMPEDLLAEIIRPAGFFRQKTRTIKGFTEAVLGEGVGELEELSPKTIEYLRPFFLSIKGIGPETADSILLYALDKPVFVVDAYTKRFVQNHELGQMALTYAGIQSFFMVNLPCDVGLFNEYHALIVALGQNHCRPKPQCTGCPLDRVRAKFSLQQKAKSIML